MFYDAVVGVAYREEPCRSALNRVKSMAFKWSLNPYMGCVHRCTFCYVRAFEHRADRPADDRYGTSIRVKVNVAGVLRRELSRPSWKRECVAVGAATDPYQPAEGRYRLTRACIEAFAEASTPFSIIHVLDPHAGRGGLAEDGAVDGSPAAAPEGALEAGRRRHQGGRRHGADPAGDLVEAIPTSRSRARSTRGRRVRYLDKPTLPAAWNARALPRQPRARLAGRARPLLAVVCGSRLPQRCTREAGARSGRGARERARRPGPPTCPARA